MSATRKVEVPELVEYATPDPKIKRHRKHLSTHRAARIAAKNWNDAAGAPLSKFTPLPVRCEPAKLDPNDRDNDSLIASAMTDKERKMRWFVVDVAEGRKSRSIEGVRCEKVEGGKPFVYRLSGGSAALAEFFRMGRMSAYRGLCSMAAKCVCRVIAVGNSKSSATVYIFDHYDDVKQAWQRGGYGDPTKPDLRIGVDPQDRPWHNGRANSKRLLTQREITEWNIPALFTVPAKPAPDPGRPARVSRPAQRSSPAASASTPAGIPESAGPAVPSAVDDAFRAYAPTSDLGLKIYAEAQAAAAELKTTIDAEEIADLIHAIMRGRTRLDNPAGFIYVAMRGRVRAWLASRSKLDAARRREEASRLKSQVYGALSDLARLAGKPAGSWDESERESDSAARFTLNAARKSDAGMVAECERLHAQQLADQERRDRGRPKEPPPPPDPFYETLHHALHEDDERPAPPKGDRAKRCPECGERSLYPDGCFSTVCMLSRSRQAKSAGGSPSE